MFNKITYLIIFVMHEDYKYPFVLKFDTHEKRSEALDYINLVNVVTNEDWERIKKESEKIGYDVEWLVGSVGRYILVDAINYKD